MASEALKNGSFEKAGYYFSENPQLSTPKKRQFFGCELLTSTLHVRFFSVQKTWQSRYPQGDQIFVTL
jgi:hypothetical protein